MSLRPILLITRSLRAACAALLLCVALLFAAATARAQPLSSASPSDAPAAELPAAGETWSAEEVRRWAAENAAAANLLETERAAAAAGARRHDQQACRRASLTRAVLGELALHQRNGAAADAMALYYRLVGIGMQREQLERADATFDTLIDLAEQAVALELPDGNVNPLRRRQLEIEDSLVQADYGARKLRRQLAGLTGRSEQHAATAVLTDSLASESALPETTDAVETAVAQRHDLKAIRELCRRTDAETLPAMRGLLSTLQPGLGLGPAAAAKAGLLLRHASRSSDLELAWRCRQCQRLLQTRIDQVRSEVEVARWDLEAAQRRTALAAEKSELAEQAAAEQAAAVELGEAGTGTDLRAELEEIEIEIERIERLVDRAVAEVRLREAQGLLVD